MSDQDAARLANLYNSLSIGLSLDAKMDFWRGKTRSIVTTSHQALAAFENQWLKGLSDQKETDLKLGYDY